jgi:hypothetical protein
MFLKIVTFAPEIISSFFIEKATEEYGEKFSHCRITSKSKNH